MDERPGSNRARASWWVIGAVLGLVVLYVVYAFLGTFVFGVFLYYATRPVYRRVRRYVGPPSVAAAGSLFLLALPAMLLVGYVVAVSVAELRELAGQVDLGPLGEIVGEYADVTEVVASPEQLLTNGGVDAIFGVAASATGFLGLFGLFALHLFVMFAVAFYLLRDDRRLSAWIQHTISDESGVLEAYLEVVDRDLNSIFFGNILNAAITGTIGAIAYSLLNLFAPPELSIPYAVLVGLLTGVASLIPIVGMKLVYVPVAGYLFARPFLADLSGVLWFPVAFLAVSVIVVDFIPDLVLRPYISGGSLHVGMVMMAYVLGPLLFGWYGLFLAPLVLVLAFHFARIILPQLVSGEPLDSATPASSTGAAGPTEGEHVQGRPAVGEDGAGSNEGAVPENDRTESGPATAGSGGSGTGEDAVPPGDGAHESGSSDETDEGSESDRRD